MLAAVAALKDHLSFRKVGDQIDSASPECCMQGGESEKIFTNPINNSSFLDLKNFNFVFYDTLTGKT